LSKGTRTGKIFYVSPEEMARQQRFIDEIKELKLSEGSKDRKEEALLS